MTAKTNLTRARWIVSLAGLLLSLFVFVSTTPAEVRLPSIISDHMVLQAGKPIVLWGWADPAEKITIRFKGKTFKTQTDRDGSWKVSLPAFNAGGPFTLELEASNRIVVQDVLIGEVWLGSGQSNMAFRLRGAEGADDAIANAGNSSLRFFTVQEAFSQDPQQDVKGAWVISAPENVAEVSAVAFFFGRDLQKTLRVPVGMIVSSVGGTRVESWMSSRTLSEDADSQAALAEWRKLTPGEFKEIETAYREYQQQRSAHAIAASEARQRGVPPPTAPKAPSRRAHDCPSALWNGMIAAITNYPIRGFLWYQGESNTSKPERYYTLFPALIQQWRRDWREDHLPFYFVQLANYAPQGERDGYARLREAQRNALSLPDVGMAVAIDIGDAKDIHPRNKHEVARRLTLWALSKTYSHRQNVCSGPLFHGMRIRGDQAILSFSYADSALISKDGASLRNFELAQAEGNAGNEGSGLKWFPATATIDGNKVIVGSDQVTKPAHVRYAWADNPEPVNFYNGAGLPASPFSTMQTDKSR